jgi:mannosyltransferase
MNVNSARAAQAVIPQEGVRTHFFSRRIPRPDWMLAVPFVVTLAVTLCDLGGASYWRDESATVIATQRSLPGLFRMLGHEDAVHGLYYVLAWGVARVFGTSEVALRWPSAAAMAAAALCVALLGRRLRSRRTGLLAGLVFACLPQVSLWGQNARSYAMVVAAAALCSYLLLGVIEQPRAGRLFGYGLSVTLLGYLNLVALLLVAAHAVTVAWYVLAGFERSGRRRLVAGWVIAAGAGAAAVTPVVVLGWQERIQIAWHAAPTWADVQLLPAFLTAGSVISAMLFAILAGLGIVRPAGPLGPHHPPELLGWLCVPWLVLPPSILFAASQWQIHLYGSSYLLFLLPAVAILAGAGLAALPAPGQIVTLALIVILALPAQVALRGPDGHGDDLRGAAQFLASHARSTDAVIYGGGPPDGAAVEPDWALAYPYGFTRPRNIGLAASPAAADNLFGVGVSAAVLQRRLRTVDRVWLVELGRDVPGSPDVPASQFRLVGTWQIADVWIRLYQRSLPVSRPVSRRPCRSCRSCWPCRP